MALGEIFDMNSLISSVMCFSWTSLTKTLHLSNSTRIEGGRDEDLYNNRELTRHIRQRVCLCRSMNCSSLKLSLIRMCQKFPFLIGYHFLIFLLFLWRRLMRFLAHLSLIVKSLLGNYNLTNIKHLIIDLT